MRPKSQLTIEIEENPEFKILIEKLHKFKRKSGASYPISDFNFKDIINKFSLNPICYLTGRKLDIKSGDFSLDHFIPPCNGGTNELDNLRICDRFANMIKFIWKIESLLPILKEILIHHGYKVTDP